MLPTLPHLLLWSSGRRNGRLRVSLLRVGRTTICFLRWSVDRTLLPAVNLLSVLWSLYVLSYSRPRVGDSCSIWSLCYTTSRVTFDRYAILLETTTTLETQHLITMQHLSRIEHPPWRLVFQVSICFLGAIWIQKPWRLVFQVSICFLGAIWIQKLSCCLSKHKQGPVVTVAMKRGVQN
jgi:hypothetical protein